MASDSGSALFSGLRFVLAGFDGATKTQFADEITGSEGQIAEQYDSSSTHVVVCNLPDSDPICKSARKDRKTLVTDSWVVDCLESETLCDSNKVLYKPPIDLGGIPKANKLHICLTGYQGSERREVEALQINSVTHLICYKFEGEKYKIAKMKGLELVNHFWLEDCLRVGSLLPESDYALSGFEAEAIRAHESVVEDSLECDSPTTEYEHKNLASLPQQQTQASFPNHLRPQTADVEQHGKLAGSEFLANSDPPSPKCVPPASDQGQRLRDEVGHVEDVSVPVNVPQSTDAIEGEVANAKSLPDAENDETTDLHVDEENGSEHSSEYKPLQDDHDELGNSRCVEAHESGRSRSRSLKALEEVESCKKRRSMDMKDFEAKSCISVDTGSKDSENKRRRRSGQAGDVSSKRTSVSSEDAKDLTSDFIAEKPGPCADAIPNQDVSVLQDPVISYPDNAPKPVNEYSNLSPDIGHMLGVDLTFTSDTDIRHEASNGSSMIKEDQLNGARSEADLQPDVTTNSGGASHSKQSGGSVTTPETAETDPKQKASPACGRPATLAELAKSYKPTSRKKSLSKKRSVLKDKENVMSGGPNQVPQSRDLNEKDAVTKKKQKTTDVLEPTTLASSKLCFAVGGASDERNKLLSTIKLLGGKICRSRLQWRDEATHLILPGPLRQTEKFLAGAAAGRWILKPEYLEASKKAGRFLCEEAFEWEGKGVNDKGSISLEAPRKWRLYCAERGIGPFAGLRAVFYGSCISPPLDTYKRAIRAGGGEVLATTPPYSLHLEDGANFAIINPGTPQEDVHVMQFLKHGLGCVTTSYFVDLVCHPASSLERHILFGTEDAVKAARTRMDAAPPRPNRSKISGPSRPQQVKHTEEHSEDVEEIPCSICGKLDGEELMLLCGDDNGAGCGIGTHTCCCTPALEGVPEDDWFCLQCWD